MHSEQIVRGRATLPVLFTATIFTSACLLFFVQPMFAKMVLPNLGGSSAVWTTAMLFFQSVLIVGYLYAHFSVRYLSGRGQLALHLCVWAAALAFLPIAVPQGWSYDPEKPAALQTLMVFALGVGVPFAALSATAPLLQAWYARAGAPGADDPYFLYGASNLGSLLSLLAFPFLAEPLFGVRAIGIGWAALYVLLGIGLTLSGLSMLGGRRVVDRSHSTVSSSDRLSVRQIAYWLFLAFLPSSLMLSTTATIATDIGSFPLVWVIPLSLYLLSFVFAFSHARWPSSPGIEKFVLIFFIYSLFIMAGDLTVKLGWMSFGALILFFFLAAILSHRRLYEARPAERHLTAFYVTMSVGGALGGLFNSILAPVLFNDVYEGPLTLVATAFLLGSRYRSASDLLAGLVVAVLCAAPVGLGFLLDAALRPYAVAALLMFFLGFWTIRQRPVAAATAAATLLVIGEAFMVPKALWKERSFFGAYRVVNDEEVRMLMHGTTNHGAEPLADIGGTTPRPTTYFASGGPLARALTAAATDADARVGIVGLGVGALGCHRKPGQSWHYYEIDAAVDRIARDPDLFDFMRTCAVDVPTHIGDARVVLAHQDLTFDVLVIDAYSSDSIPVHLMTTDAVKVYLDRLAPDGIIAFHISNRFFDLQPVLARIARDLGLEGRAELYYPAEETRQPGELPSQAVVVSRDPSRLAEVTANGNWQPLVSDDSAAWTDDYSNLLGALR